jgi:hypothetical protein
MPKWMRRCWRTNSRRTVCWLGSRSRWTGQNSSVVWFARKVLCSRVGDAAGDVGVLFEFKFGIAFKRNQHDLNSFAPCEFHCGDEIAVSSDQHDSFNNPFARKPSHIESDVHVHPFLRKFGVHVGGGQR